MFIIGVNLDKNGLFNIFIVLNGSYVSFVVSNKLPRGLKMSV